MYLLDTNVWIHYLNNTTPSVRHRLEQCRPEDVFLSEIVRFELIFGALKSQRRTENMQVIQLLTAQFGTLPFDVTAAEVAAEIRHDLQRQGTPIGAYDVLIAATAIAHRAVLVTHNVGEFSRIPALRIENWVE